jgi:hypothetical protein
MTPQSRIILLYSTIRWRYTIIFIGGMYMVTFKKLGLKMHRGNQEGTWTVLGKGVEFTEKGNKGHVMSLFLNQFGIFNAGTGWHLKEDE